MKDFWWSFNPDIKCQTPAPEEKDHTHGLGLESIGGVFIVIFVGIVIATVILAMEYPIFMLWRMITRSQVKTGAGRLYIKNNVVYPNEFRLPKLAGKTVKDDTS